MMPDSFYRQIAQDYVKKRDLLCNTLQEIGLAPSVPKGAYYVMTDVSGFGFADDVAFVKHLIENLGVAAVPGSSFYASPGGGSQQVRFCFCKRFETLESARIALQKLT